MSNVGDQVAKAVESAKEAAVKMGEEVSDFFQGNPFTTPVGVRIEQATDANTLATENWALNMEICDFINSSEDMAKDAIRAIKKRLQTNMSKNNAIVMYTLTVLETCVKNCKHHFHYLVCNKDFITFLVKLIETKFDAPQIIQERVLGLIQSWADAFKSQPDLQGVVQVYLDLQQKGIQFPASDLDALAPILTPKRTIDPVRHQQRRYVQQYHYPAQPAAAAASSNVDLLNNPTNGEQIKKDLDIINGNINVFREMLAEVQPDKATNDELQLLVELNASLRPLQHRVLALIGNVSDEDLTSILLAINDDFNNVFEKFDNFMSIFSTRQSSSAGALNLGNETVPLTEQMSRMNVVSADQGYAANNERQAEVGLGTAIQNKIPSETEVKEMEGWLDLQSEIQKDKEGQNSKTDPENDKL